MRAILSQIQNHTGRGVRGARALCLTLLLGLSLHAVAMAQTPAAAFKVGYVSLDRLLAESVPAKKARAALDKDFKSRERNLEKKAADIRLQQQKYEKDFPKLTEPQKVEREQSIGKAVMVYEEEKNNFETELSTAQNTLLQDLLKQANGVIRDYAKKEGFDLIVQEAVYIKPEYDITQHVLDALK